MTDIPEDIREAATEAYHSIYPTILVNGPLGGDPAKCDFRAVSITAIALAILAERERCQAWQPIETAPKDGTLFLATGGGLGQRIDTVRYTRSVSCWSATDLTLDDCDNELNGYSRPTHWMPLPPPPKSERATNDDTANFQPARAFRS